MLAAINKGKVVKVGTEIYSEDSRKWKVVEFIDDTVVLQELYRCDRNIRCKQVKVKVLFKKYLID